MQISKKFELKSEIPFGPFLILAFWTVYIFQVDVLA
jgi:prepilin signal peptidase PulO-like enzyme (type II secretory pathway)